MSQYIEFFVEREGVITPVASFSRSNAIYQALVNEVPYEKATLLTEEIYKAGNEFMEEKIRTYKGFIKDYKEENTLIMSATDVSLNERLERVHENNSTIEDIEEEIEHITAQSYYLNAYHMMGEEYYQEKGSMKNHKVKVYVGIECGSNPEVI